MMVRRWAFQLGDLFAVFCVSAARYDDGTALTVGPAVAVLHRRWWPTGIAFDLGWGWDRETPVRPWPVLRIAEPLPRSGARRTGLYWLGFYASACWGRTRFYSGGVVPLSTPRT